MTKRRVGIASIIILMIAIGTWVALPRYGGPSGSVAGGPETAISENKAGVRPAVAATKPVAASDLWTRPPAEAVSRNRRKSGFAWVLRPLGATEQQLDRLVGGDLNGVVTELKQKAQAGDLVSTRVLGQLAVLNCRSDRRRLTGFKRRQVSEAQRLPTADLDWFAATVNDDIAFDNELDSVCEQIDTKQALADVTARANQGDGASLWVLSQSGLKTEDMQQRFRDASAAGFALAQFSLAALIDHGDAGAAGAGPSKLSSLDLLNQSASAIPASRAELANCEYFGECEGILVDIDAAIAHAREAAQEGYFSAILKIGPHLPAGQMDPNEVTAWGLIDASVEQQGCGGNVFTVRAMQNIMSTLNATNITAAARMRAEQFWSEYGSQIKANLGCGP